MSKTIKGVVVAEVGHLHFGSRFDLNGQQVQESIKDNANPPAYSLTRRYSCFYLHSQKFKIIRNKQHLVSL